MHSGLRRNVSYHEVGAIADVGRCSEKNRAERNGDERLIVTFDELQNIRRIVDAEILVAESGGEKSEVGGSVVEQPGKSAGRPIKLHGRPQAQARGVALEIIERRC